MTPEITVRPADADDLDALEKHDPRKDGHLAVEHLQRAQEGRYLFATAWDDDEPLGWGVLDYHEGELEPQLAHLWIFPESRRQGAGRAISTWLEKRAKELGYHEVFLRVDPDNGAAVPLWLDLGYTPTGEHEIATDLVTGESTHQAIYRKSLKHSR